VRYELDEVKNRSNVAKHGLDFADAEQVLTGPCGTFEDGRFDYGEELLITLGLLAGRVVIIAHAPRGDGITRIIFDFTNKWRNRLSGREYQEAVVLGGYNGRFTVGVPPTTLRSCKFRGGMEVRKEGVHPVLPNILVGQASHLSSPRALDHGPHGKRYQFSRRILNFRPLRSSSMLPIACFIS
jgi:uncharacterized protein